MLWSLNLSEASSVADIQKAAAATVQDCCGSKLSVLNPVIYYIYIYLRHYNPKLEPSWNPNLLVYRQESRGHCSGLTKRIARIGSYGKYPNNCERDLFRALDLPLATGCD